eukprot:8810563-Ditylum_brightwellii.AAC.2
MSVATKELVAMARELKTNLVQMQGKLKEGEAKLTHFEGIKLRVEKGHTISALKQVIAHLKMAEVLAATAIEEA